MSVIGKMKLLKRAIRYMGVKKEYRTLEKTNYRSVARDIAPSVMKNRPTYLQCDNTIIKYLVVGITRHGERGLPKNLNARVLNDLMAVAIGEEYTIGLTTAIVPVPNIEATKAINHACLLYTSPSPRDS